VNSKELASGYKESHVENSYSDIPKNPEQTLVPYDDHPIGMDVLKTFHLPYSFFHMHITLKRNSFPFDKLIIHHILSAL
jgi:hypothetical protein